MDGGEGSSPEAQQSGARQPDPVARRLATWLVRKRPACEKALREAGRSLPAPDSPEAEALRRFRSFLTTGLLRADAFEPALEGLRVRERRVVPLARAWVEAVVACAGPQGPAVRSRLDPLLERFVLAVRATAPARRASGAPRSTRRAVPAAIDRVADAFFAVDTETGLVVDANPAAGALLATTRDALVGNEFGHHVPEDLRERIWGELDAVAEGTDARLVRAALCDGSGRRFDVEGSITGWTTRRRTLALLLVRPAEAVPVPARPGALRETAAGAPRPPAPGPADASPDGSRS